MWFYLFCDFFQLVRNYPFRFLHKKDKLIKANISTLNRNSKSFNKETIKNQEKSIFISSDLCERQRRRGAWPLLINKAS